MSVHGRWPAYLFLLRGATRDDALARIESAAHPIRDANLPDAALARAMWAEGGPAGVAIVATGRDELLAKVIRARDARKPPPGVFPAADEAQRGKVAFLFPGQGSQRVGMLADVFDAFPQVGYLLELGARWRGTMFPEPASTSEEEAAQQAAITDTRVAQPTLGIAGLAMARVLADFGVRPDMAAGHSYGELVALCVAGAFSEPALLELSYLRGRRIVEAAQGADAGTMAAASADAQTVTPFLAGLDGVIVANENSPVQSVISGPTEGVRTAVAKLLDAGIAATPIPVACAFHSPLVRAACATFAEDLAKVEVSKPGLPVYANTTASLYPRDADGIRAMLARHIGEPVRFAAQVEAMYADGARIFVEAGPGRVLTGLVGRILGKRPHVAVVCDRPGENGVVQLLMALGQIAAAGFDLDYDAPLAYRDEARI